jgi:hypothetical protein
LIDHIVRDTVINRLGVPVRLLSRFSRRVAQSRADFAKFEELTDRVLQARHTDAGLWKRFRSDAPDEVLRSNIKVFLAGAFPVLILKASQGKLPRRSKLRWIPHRDSIGVELFFIEHMKRPRR